MSDFLFCLLVQFFHSTRLVELTVGFEEREDGEVFVAEHAHYEDFTEALRETELEYDTFLGFLDLAVRCEEECFVAAAGVGGVGAEGGGAVVEGHHASFLADAVAVGDEVRVLLEGAGGGVDAAVLEEDGLCLEFDLVDEDILIFFHCCEFCEEGVLRLAIFTCKTLFTHITRVILLFLISFFNTDCTDGTDVRVCLKSGAKVRPCCGR